MGHYVDLLKKTLKESRYDRDRAYIYGSPNERTPGEEHRDDYPDEPHSKSDEDRSYEEIAARHAEAKRLGISPDELLKRRVAAQLAKIAAKNQK